MPTTTTAARTTSTTTRAERFQASARANLTGLDQRGLDALTDAAQAMCDLLGDVETQVNNDNAANDSAASDAAIIATVQQTAIGALAEKFDPNTAATVLRMAGSNLCPDHSDKIERFITDNLG